MEACEAVLHEWPLVYGELQLPPMPGKLQRQSLKRLRVASSLTSAQATFSRPCANSVRWEVNWLHTDSTYCRPDPNWLCPEVSLLCGISTFHTPCGKWPRFEVKWLRTVSNYRTTGRNWLWPKVKWLRSVSSYRTADV